MNYNRQDLVEDLTNEVSRGYATILGRMAGIQIRIDRQKAANGITTADYKASKYRIEGLQMACESLYRLAFPGVLLGDLDARLRSDLARWKKATTEDEKSDGEG